MTKKGYKAGLKKTFVCFHLTLGFQIWLVSWDFFYFGEGQPCS